LVRGFFVCDENFDFYSVDPSLVILPSKSDLGSCQNLTILDCEITFNYHFELYCMMIYDIMYSEGKCVVMEPLSQRLKVIRDDVIAPFRKLYPEDKQKNLPFLFLGKDYFDLGQIDRLLSKIHKYEDKDEPSGVRYLFFYVYIITFSYLYQNGIRYNDNEGLILTSEDKCYKPGFCISLKKWRFQKLNTVDFLVKKTTHKNGTPSFLFYVQVGDKRVQYREVYLDDQSSTRLLNDLNGQTEAIIECYYDHITHGEWRYYNICHDKRFPTNHINIIQQLEVISENITEEELLKTFVGKTSSSRTRYSPSKQSLKNPSERISPQSNVSPINDDDVVYESPLKTEEKNNILKRKRTDESPEMIEYDIVVKKARLNPSPIPE